MNQPDIIFRYTDLPGALYMLQTKQLTLLNPESWDDTNDSHFLKLYKGAKELTCLAALCFSEAEETYHHWRIFAGGSSGVRIEFDRDKLLAALEGIEGIRHEKVEYLLIKDLKKGAPTISELPFLKRQPYQNENEYRVIYESRTREQSPVDVPLSLKAIRRITLSPWMNKNVSKSVRELIKTIPECEDLSVPRSTLIGNDEWMAYGDAALKAHEKKKAAKLKKKKSNRTT
jgi:hypothetical protein